MTPEQIREVVKITIDELTKRKLLEVNSYQSVLKVVEPQLYHYFINKSDCVSHILRQISDDPYIDIIFFKYRDGRTLEWIAEVMDKDVSTIKRNKKRLIQEVYKLLYT